MALRDRDSGERIGAKLEGNMKNIDNWNDRFGGAIGNGESPLFHQGPLSVMKKQS